MQGQKSLEVNIETDIIIYVHVGGVGFVVKSL